MLMIFQSTELVPLILNTCHSLEIRIDETDPVSGLSLSETLHQGGVELRILIEKFQSSMLEESIASDADSFSSDEDNDDWHPPARAIVQTITSVSGCLVDLLPTLEKAVTLSQESSMRSNVAPSTAFQVSEPASYFVRNVTDKFRKAEVKLAERLGEANWQRHERIRRLMQAASEGEDADLEEPVACSVFQPSSMFHDSGIGTSKPAETTYATSNTSYTSFFSSVTAERKGSLRVPDIPEDAADGKPFKCDFCGHLLSSIKTRADWK
jgi:hypothetical protein